MLRKKINSQRRVYEAMKYSDYRKDDIFVIQGMLLDSGGELTFLSHNMAYVLPDEKQ